MEVKGRKREEGGQITRGQERAAADSALWSRTLPVASASPPARERLTLF